MTKRTNTNAKTKSFKWKSFISIGLFISFFIIAFTGIILYITPPGRVAKWVNWQLLGLSKDQWQAQHTIFAYTFVILSIFHIFTMNWKVFLSYLKNKTSGGFQMKRELIAGVVLTIVLFFGTIFSIPPFKTIVDVGEYFTESWEKKEQRAPVAHTEALSIKELSKQVVALSPAAIMQKLRDKSIAVEDADQTLKEIGKKNNMSPYEIYKMISEGEEKRKTGNLSLSRGSGFGRKTLEEIAEIMEKNVDELVEILENAGITAESGEQLKNIAQRVGKTPIEIIQLLENK